MPAPALKPKLRQCLVVITMPDKSKGQHVGLYPDTVAAAQRAMEYFPEAVRITARPLRTAKAPQ